MVKIIVIFLAISFPIAVFVSYWIYEKKREAYMKTDEWLIEDLIKVRRRAIEDIKEQMRYDAMEKIVYQMEEEVESIKPYQEYYNKKYKRSKRK